MTNSGVEAAFPPPTETHGELTSLGTSQGGPAQTPSSLGRATEQARAPCSTNPMYHHVHPRGEPPRPQLLGAQQEGDKLHREPQSQNLAEHLQERSQSPGSRGINLT